MRSRRSFTRSYVGGQAPHGAKPGVACLKPSQIVRVRFVAKPMAGPSMMAMQVATAPMSCSGRTRGADRSDGPASRREQARAALRGPGRARNPVVTPELVAVTPGASKRRPVRPTKRPKLRRRSRCFERSGRPNRHCRRGVSDVERHCLPRWSVESPATVCSAGPIELARTTPGGTSWGTRWARNPFRHHRAGRRDDRCAKYRQVVRAHHLVCANVPGWLEGSPGRPSRCGSRALWCRGF